MKTILKMAVIGLMLTGVFETTAQIGDKIKLKEKLKEKIKIPEGKNTPGSTNNNSNPIENVGTVNGVKPLNNMLKIIFSDKPFASNQTESTKEVFTPKDNIYGRIVLDRPLKRFKSDLEGGDFVTLDFYMGDTSWYTNMDMRSSKQPLTKDELNAGFVDFEIWVNKSQKREPTIKQFNFPHIVSKIAQGMYKRNASPKISFRIKLDKDGSAALNGTGNGARFNPKIETYGEFTIDFTGISEQELRLLTYCAKSPVYDSDYISPKYLNKAILTTGFVKTLPLPEKFNAEKGNGYRDPKMTEEEIKKLIFAQFNTNEIVYFQFLKPLVNADYSEERSEGDGMEGMEKRGNKHVLVVFKDKDDGFYRTMECTVIKHYGHGTEVLSTYLRTFPWYNDNTRSSSEPDLPSADIHATEYLYYIDFDKLPK